MNTKVTLIIKEYNLNFVDIELNNLTFLTGTNGSGKSIANISVWFCNFLNHCKYNPSIGELPLSLIQSYFNNIFTNPLSGTMILHCNDNKLNTYNGYIEIIFKKGIVNHVKYIHIDLDSSNFPVPMYLSTNTRLFSNHDHYLILRKTVKDMGDLLNFYKLYDIQFFEIVLNIGRQKLQFEKEDLTPFEQFDTCGINLNEIKSFYLDENETSYYIDYLNTKSNKIKSSKVSSLSNGTQAIISMALPLIQSNFSNGIKN